MENIFRVFVYSEGEPPLFHDGPCKSIYSMEGRFMHTLETRNRFLTGDPEKAHVYFLPFSITKMVKFLYRPPSFDIGHIELTIADYVNVIAQKYRFWNRSLGADHFILSCHDWVLHQISKKGSPSFFIFDGTCVFSGSQSFIRRDPSLLQLH